jgi:uncharacterized coiled-coil protein SlyX
MKKTRADYRRAWVWAAEISAAYIIGKGKYMTRDEEIQFARYKESVIRADDTIDTMRETIAAQQMTMQAQQDVIDLLHKQIGKMEGQLSELQAALCDT